MKAPFLTALLITIGILSYSQNQGFLSVYEDEEHISWETFDAIETEHGDYLIAVNEWNQPQWKSKILKLSGNGDFCKEMVLEANDTTMRLCNLYSLKHNPNSYLGFAVCNNVNVIEEPSLMTIHFDEDLNITSRKIVSMPSFGGRLSDIKFLNLENEYIAAVTFSFGINGRTLALYRIADNGDILQSAACEADSLSYINNLFCIHDKPNCFGMFIKATSSSDASAGVILFDNTLQIYKRFFYGSWISEEYNHQCLSYLSPLNSMFVPTPDRNYVISSQLSESLIMHSDDQSAILVKTDTDFLLMPNRQVIGHLNDTVDRPAFFKSVDYSSDAIYQCSMQNMYAGSWPWQHCGLNLVVTKTDFDLNIIWKKRFLVDGNVYSPYNLIVTPDGGCLITGTRYDHNTEHRLDVFALKLDADGMCRTQELITEEAINVYPNPTANSLTISTDDLECVEIYNMFGQIVAEKQSEGNADLIIDMSGLLSGVYIVKVSDTHGKTCIRKVLKE